MRAFLYWVVLCFLTLQATASSEDVRSIETHKKFVERLRAESELLQYKSQELEKRLDVEFRHSHRLGKHSRHLLQKPACELSGELGNEYYDSDSKTWNLNQDLFDAIEKDLQKVIDCLPDFGTVLISQELELEPISGIVIHRPITLTSNLTRFDDLPKWSCASQENHSIAVIQDTEKVHFVGIHFYHCNSTDGAPIDIESANVTISDSIFEKLSGNSSGAIVAVSSTLNLEKSLFTQIETFGVIFTAAITAFSGSMITVDECVFERIVGAFGGCIAFMNHTSATVTDCSFLNNVGKYGAAILGISNDSSTNLIIDHCDFRNNKAVYGGVLFLRDTKLDMLSSNFVENEGTEYAGGLASSFSNASKSFSDEFAVSIENCLFERNRSPFGGAIFLFDEITLNVTNSTFTKNFANISAGAIFAGDHREVLFDNVVFNENRAKISGGSVFVLNSGSDENDTRPGIITMIRSKCQNNKATFAGCLLVFSDNFVDMRDSLVESNFAESGGGVVCSDGAYLTLTNVILRNNYAEYNGGAIWIFSLLEDAADYVNSTVKRSHLFINRCIFQRNKAGSFAGGIVIFDFVSATVSDTVFQHNVANKSAGIHLFGSTRDPRNYSSIQSSFEESGTMLQMINDARKYIRDDIRSPPNSFIFSSTIVLTNVTFLFNKAFDSGALGADVGAVVWIRNSAFEKNKASGGSGIGYFVQSFLFCEDSVFFENSASHSGGAFTIHGLSHLGSLSPFSEGYFRNTVFIDNVSGHNGGAILVVGLDAYLTLIKDVTFRGNKARVGGAIASISTAQVTLSTSTFTQNEALESGGAIGILFMENSFTFFDCNDVAFSENSANLGGAIYAENAVFAANNVDSSFDFGPAHNEAKMRMNNIHFSRNHATNGGALHLKAVAASLKNISFQYNDATDMGGALLTLPWSGVDIVESTFHNNTAVHGGGIRIGENSVLHCINCKMTKNHASFGGGAVSIRSPVIRSLPVVLQCDHCIVKGNTAALGGGIYYHYEEKSDHDDTAGYAAVLRGVVFTDNFATIGGGGLIVSRPEFVGIVCSVNQTDYFMGPNIKDGFLKVDEMDGLQSLMQSKCRSWIRNRVGTHGYGPLRATFVDSVMVCRTDSECRFSIFQLPVHRSTGFVPSIRIVLVDRFGQRKAEPHPDDPYLYAEVSSSNVRLSGQANSRFERGEAVLNETIVTGNPGKYAFNLSFPDSRIESVVMKSGLQFCEIGEESVLNNTACQKCEVGTYAIEEPLDQCKECPDGCTCKKWGIYPNKGHWSPSPCIAKAQECISEDSCDYDDRVKNLESWFDDTNPTCDLESSNWQRYQSVQCAEGYEDKLCGSCSLGYGRIGSSCQKCLEKGIIVLLLLLYLGWFCFLAFVSIKGNLSCCMLSDKPLIERDAPRSSETSPQLTELYILGPNGRKQETIEDQTTDIASEKATKRDIAKRSVTERLKLFVNFAQVTSTALLINYEWTKGIKTFLRVLDFTGAVSTEAAMTLECLFPETSLARSMKKTILSLSLPFSLLVLICGFWVIKSRNDRQTMKKRLVLSASVVLYISYIGLARRLISILNCENVYLGTTTADAFWKRFWSQDTSVACFEGSHAVLFGFFAIPLAVIVLLGFPISVAVFLIHFRSKNALETIGVKEMFGFLFQAYKEDFVFWDSLVLFRKAALALISIFGSSLGTNLQGLISECILLFALLLQNFVQPFNDLFGNLNRNESFSLATSLFTFISGLFLNDTSLTTGGRIFISVVVILWNLSFFVYFAIDIYIEALKFFRYSLETDNAQIKEKEIHFVLVWLWIKHNAGKGIDSIKTKLSSSES